MDAPRVLLIVLCAVYLGLMAGVFWIEMDWGGKTSRDDGMLNDRESAL